MPNSLRCLSIVFALAILIGCSSCDKSTDPPPPPPPPDPSGLTATNGLYYKFVMGDTVSNEPLDFEVKDEDGNSIANQWVHFTRTAGDGILSADSVITNSSGVAHITYRFSGALGHATIEAMVPDLDTLYVFLRANTLIPGDGGQGQYIRVDDTYAEVVAFNGQPDKLDTIPDASQIMVANYETSLGVVFVIYDTDEDSTIEATSPVFQVIVVDSIFPQNPDSTVYSARYEGKTADSLGIGTRFWCNACPNPEDPDILTTLGGTNNIRFDNEPPPAIVFTYDDLYLTFWCHQFDSTAYQIDIAEQFDATLFQAPAGGVDLGKRISNSVRSYFMNRSQM